MLHRGASTKLAQDKALLCMGHCRNTLLPDIRQNPTLFDKTFPGDGISLGLSERLERRKKKEKKNNSIITQRSRQKPSKAMRILPFRAHSV